MVLIRYKLSSHRNRTSSYYSVIAIRTAKRYIFLKSPEIVMA